MKDNSERDALRELRLKRQGSRYVPKRKLKLWEFIVLYAICIGVSMIGLWLVTQ